MRNGYGTEQKTCDRHEGYHAGGNADSRLCDGCD